MLYGVGEIQYTESVFATWYQRRRDTDEQWTGI